MPVLLAPQVVFAGSFGDVGVAIVVLVVLLVVRLGGPIGLTLGIEDGIIQVGEGDCCCGLWLRSISAMRLITLINY